VEKQLVKLKLEKDLEHLEVVKREVDEIMRSTMKSGVYTLFHRRLSITLHTINDLCDSLSISIALVDNHLEDDKKVISDE